MAEGRRDLLVGEPRAGSHGDHRAHQVDAGRLLGHRMLHLEPGVDLEERERAVRREQELNGAGPTVACMGADRPGGGVDAGALLLGDEGRGRLLDELLVAPLQRTVAGAEHLDLPVPVAEHLRLDMPGPVEELLDIAFAAAEGGQRLAGGGLEELLDLLKIPGDLHAAPAAAMGGLYGDGQAMRLGKGAGLGRGGDRAGGAGNQRRADRLGDAPRFDLVAERLNHVGIGADPDQAGFLHGAGEFGALRQEAVTRMHRVGARAQGDGDELGRVEIGLRRAFAAERIRLVGEPDEERVAVAVGIGDDRDDPLVTAGADDPNGDLAAIGDEQAADRTQRGAGLEQGRRHGVASIGLKGWSAVKRMRAPGGICPASGSASGSTVAMTG